MMTTVDIAEAKRVSEQRPTAGDREAVDLLDGMIRVVLAGQRLAAALIESGFTESLGHRCAACWSDGLPTPLYFHSVRYPFTDPAAHKPTCPLVPFLPVKMVVTAVEEHADGTMTITTDEPGAPR